MFAEQELGKIAPGYRGDFTVFDRDLLTCPEDELLEAEDALRTQMERVAELRRGLPLGGEPPEDYVFEERGHAGAVQKVKLSELFAPGKDSLLLYGFMFGPALGKLMPELIDCGEPSIPLDQFALDRDFGHAEAMR